MDAALLLFARYGFQRTSMADIAREAGMSRPALYLRFSGKEAVFQALAAKLVADALARAAAAWDDAAGFADNLATIVLAKDLPLVRAIYASPHAAELMSVDTALTARHAAALESGFAAMLAAYAGARASAGWADLSAYGDAEAFGETVARLAAGIKHEARDEAAYVDLVHRLARILARATEPR